MNWLSVCRWFPAACVAAGCPDLTLWEASKHPLVAVLVGGLISIFVVPWIVNRYQVNGKVMDFRFQVYRDAAVVYTNLVAAAWRLMVPRATLQAFSKAPPTRPGAVEEQEDELRRRTEEFDHVELPALRLLTIMPTLYGKKVQESWAKALDLVGSVRLEADLAKNRKALDEGGAAQATFALAAAKEIPLPYEIGRLVDPKDVAEARAVVDDALRFLESLGKNGQVPRGEGQ